MNLTSWLHGLYLFTAVFGVGVTAVDMLGLLGTGEGDGNGSGEGDGAGGENADGADDGDPVIAVGHLRPDRRA